MRKALGRPPKTIMEVYQNLPEGTLAELIDSTIYMSPSPVSTHQIILNEINYQLLKHFKENASGMVFISPLDIYLDESSNAVQPDIIVVLNESKSIINKSGHIHGVPDLLVEVLSPSNKEHDLIRKKDLYERFGVKEYWIVDPDAKLALGYSMENSRFKLIHEEIGSFDSPLLKLKFEF